MEEPLSIKQQTISSTLPLLETITINILTALETAPQIQLFGLLDTMSLLRSSSRTRWLRCCCCLTPMISWRWWGITHHARSTVVDIYYGLLTWDESPHISFVARRLFNAVLSERILFSLAQYLRSRDRRIRIRNYFRSSLKKCSMEVVDWLTENIIIGILTITRRGSLFTFHLQFQFISNHNYTLQLEFLRYRCTPMLRSRFFIITSGYSHH